MSTQELVLHEMGTGEAIREYLQVKEEGYPYEFYKIFREFKPTTSYASVRRYFYILEEIGLIMGTEWREGERGFKRHYYELVEAKAEDPAWWHPQQELYPATALGKAGYEKLREEGLKPKGGRKWKYRK